MTVTGTWNLTLNSPLGTQTAVLVLQEVGGAWQGTLAGKGDPTPLERLTVEGDKLEFSADADTPVGRLKLAFDGAAAGDAISGKYTTPFGAFDFSGSRA
jgi:hypothetical protein